ncbi:hypothetical protein Q8A73_022665 [Channa argus]|nr:hypothetical protein Q8A73_022665 [Channa argus]
MSPLESGQSHHPKRALYRQNLACSGSSANQKSLTKIQQGGRGGREATYQTPLPSSFLVLFRCFVASAAQSSHSLSLQRHCGSAWPPCWFYWPCHAQALKPYPHNNCVGLTWLMPFTLCPFSSGNQSSISGRRKERCIQGPHVDDADGASYIAEKSLITR